MILGFRSKGGRMFVGGSLLWWITIGWYLAIMWGVLYFTAALLWWSLLLSTYYPFWVLPRYLHSRYRRRHPTPTTTPADKTA